MERNEKEVVASDIAGNADLQGKACDFPLKLEDHNVFESPIMCASLRSDWPESSTHGCIGPGRVEDRDSSTCVISLAGSVPPKTNPCSMNDVGNVFELTEGNYRTPNLSLVSSPLNNRRGKWQHHLSELPSGSIYKVLQGVHDTQESSACLRTNDKRIISSCNVDIPLNNLPTSSSFQLLVKKALKGKGALAKNEDAEAGFSSAARKIASDALMRSSANSNKLSLHWIDGSSPESIHHGISLREWMKRGHCRRDNVESLLIFRRIVELVDSAHSQGVALQDLRPSFFNLLPSNKIVYTGSSAKRESKAAVFHDLLRKRPMEQDTGTYGSLVRKQQKLGEDLNSFGHQSQFASNAIRTMADEISSRANGAQDSGNVELQSERHSNYQSSCMKTNQRTLSLTVQLEEKWYRSPEQLNGGFSTFSSNIYSLGVLLFELLSWFESHEIHSIVMLDLHQRILPSNFLSKYPKEAGFCLWFLHPEPSARPTASEILQSELICQSQECCSGNDVSTCPDNNDAELELLLHFLNLLKEQKQMHASKLIEHIEWLEDDIKEVEKGHFSRFSSVFSQTDAREQGLHLGASSVAISGSFSDTNMNEERSMRNVNQIDNAYFSMRSQIHLSSASCFDKDFLKSQDRWSAFRNEKEESNMIQKSADPLGAFFDGLCKFARYSKFEVCGSLKNGDLLSSTNVLCSLSFDRDEEYIAAAGASKKIKVFEFGTLLNDSIDIHYPVVEMSNKSKLSCVCWNNHIKNYLASTDYDGVIQIWDAGTGQGFSQYTDHQKRAWSVDFSLANPMMFASGSDDCSVRLWSINERGSIGTIWNPANICCVQFSASSAHFLAFGSADYKIYCYDLRHTRTPWSILAGHEKAVSYVKFLDSETLVSASTDNTLKLWDLEKTSSPGLSSSTCRLTFGGHTNKKNFVGLSALDGYIACGSETNEVYCYYRSLPMPITSYKFGYVDPISGNKIDDDNGQFVSSVCWRQKSNMVVAANSMGKMKVLKMV
ncbi:hypothetical protein P3X46_014846 [Hevea brasiliensis]|uniref:Protein kinase domain-containing protein n=1 Tax=Hevea brasiliensis TaxID=3981 RepID=A0ABQ9LVB2_HEVBR|nr:protein SUPPRESSOR OF PHYA-105 1 [Hevea brasiliensis]KAJ9171483.1 hypothetical protein P3X46_014846 [Hevea brasiliensis]